MVQSSDLLVITSAGGIQCSHFIPLIYGKYNLRLVVRSESSRDHLRRQYPDADVVCADIAEPAQCKEILKGATRVYHVGPSLHPHELEIGLYMVDAAIEENNRTHGGLKHFIFSSVLNTQIRKMYNHDRKRYIEEHLIESGLAYTILNPCDFLNMAFPVKRFYAMDEPRYVSLKGLESKSAFLVLEDYAEACAKILDEGARHHHAQYQMCSMPPIAYGEVARDVGVALGRDFPVTLRPLEDAFDFLTTALFGDPEQADPVARDGCQRLELYYRTRGLPGNPNTLEWILGRKPTSHTEWIARQIEEAKQEAPEARSTRKHGRVVYS